MSNVVSKTQTARIWMLVDDGTDAEILKIDDLVSDAPITPGAPITVDATTFADLVTRLVTVGESPSTIAMALVVGEGAGPIADLIAIRTQAGKKSKMYIQLPNYGTAAPPTTPTLTDGVLGWTLPAIVGTDFAFDCEIQTSTPVIAKNEIDREAVSISIEGKILRGLAGSGTRS